MAGAGARAVVSAAGARPGPGVRPVAVVGLAVAARRRGTRAIIGNGPLPRAATQEERVRHEKSFRLHETARFFSLGSPNIVT